MVAAPSWWAVSRAVSVTPSGSTPLSEPSVAVVSPFTQSVPPPLTQVPRSDAPAETDGEPRGVGRRGVDEQHIERGERVRGRPW